MLAGTVAKHQFLTPHPAKHGTRAVRWFNAMQSPTGVESENQQS
jgi:hypothetical protein